MNFRSHRLLAFVLAVAGCLTLLMGAASSAEASSTTHVTTMKFTPTKGGPRLKDQGGAALRTSSACPDGSAALAPFAKRGVHEVGCLTSGTAKLGRTASELGGPSSAPAVSPDAAPVVWCDTDGEDEWWITRSQGCTSDVPMTFELFDSETGELIGEADLEFSDSITLNATSGQFQETNYITMLDENDVPELLTTYIGSCDALCYVSSSAAEDDAVLTPGETVSGVVTYSDTPAVGANDFVDMANSIVMDTPGGAVISPGSVGGQPQLRCDTGMYTDPASSSTGCIYPQVDPTVEFTLSGTGSTAAIDAWAEESEDAAWGYYTPLTRLVSSAQRDANRAAICGSFVSLYPNDSCEEYPFASTTQSGGYNGLTGADCAQVQAVNDDGTWEIEILGNYTGAEGCVVGHADTTSQNSQGATLRNFYAANRIIDGDQFYVAIGD